MAAKSHYELLDLQPTASHDEIKRAFRALIARYHPDKVQHLGKEFQDMAADRAAELTEAYRVLSDEGRRAKYDRALREGGGASAAPSAVAAPPAPAPPASAAAPPPPQAASEPAAAHKPRPSASGPPGSAYTQERASRDEYVRKATVGRFRQALAAVASDYDQGELKGFDIVCVPKSKLFGRSKGPRLLGRFVSHVDGSAVAEAWGQAGRWSTDEICVFLMGSSVAPARELADAIAEQRKKTRGKVTLIPVDVRDWAAHVPTDAPDLAKSLLARLKRGT